MDKLNCANNQVILGVKAGRGFGFLDKSFVIEASLNGHTLETDLLQPANEILIGAELLWEAEKKVLKRLRTGNVPLKVECFSVLNGKKQEKVGYLLLTLRAAKTVPPNSILSNVPDVWHSLLGVRAEVKCYCPSLLISLYIEDISIAGNNILHPKDNIPSLTTHYPKPFLQNDMIQIGPYEPSAAIFLLTIYLESVANLELLADSDLEKTGNFDFSCNIMGCQRKGGTFSELSSFLLDSENTFSVKISSSLKNLKNYIKEQEIACIKLSTRGHDFAIGEINGSFLISLEDLQDYFCLQSSYNPYTLRKRCYFMKSSTHDTPVSSSGSKPYVETVITFQYLCNDSNKGLGQGDGECCVIHTPCESISINDNYSMEMKNTNKLNAFSNMLEEQIYMQEWFTLNIFIQSVLIYKISNVDKFQFRFEQANAIAVLKHCQEVRIDTANNFVPVQGITCSLFIQGSLKDVQREFSNCKPIVELMAISGEDCKSFAQCEVDVNPLIENQLVNYCIMDLKETTSSEKCGSVKFNLSLDKVTIIKKEKCRKSPFSACNITPLLQLHSTERALKEIEEWKKQQKELFMMELREKESKHLEAVVEDWENRQKEYELALNNNVQHCTELATSLSHATDELRSKSQIIAQKEMELSHIQTTLEIEYQSKLQECREASRRMEDDFKLEISRLHAEKESLLDQIGLQEKENIHLLKIQKELENELERLKKNTLTEDQTATLLKELKLSEEKYEIAYRSKVFFKEQWARAMREIHIMKSKHMEEMNNQIKSHKEELKCLGRMLPPCESNSCLQSGSSRQHETRDISSALEPNEGPHLDIDSLYPMQQLQPMNSVKEDENEGLQKSTLENKLQELVQERDSLLNTGTYTLDHVLITKLNKEIRLLLAESNHKFI